MSTIMSVYIPSSSTTFSSETKIKDLANSQGFHVGLSNFNNSSCRKIIKHVVGKSWKSLRKLSNNLSLTRKGFRMGYRRQLVNEK